MGWEIWASALVVRRAENATKQRGRKRRVLAFIGKWDSRRLGRKCGIIDLLAIRKKWL
jgi:hypothetical protein